MNNLAKRYRLPEVSTPEKLELAGFEIVKYSIYTIVVGYYYSPDGKHYFSAIYTGGRTCEDEVKLGWISSERFEDDGHAIKRAFEAL